MKKEVIMEGQPPFIEDSTAPWDNLLEEDFHVKVFYDKISCNRRTLVIRA